MTKESGLSQQINCPLCGSPMRKIKWEIGSGSETYNVHLEVERTVLRCGEDATTITLDIPTGDKSDYA